MTFDKNDKLLTGLQFFLMISRPIFLSNSLTMATFHWYVNCPDSKERLTIFIMDGRHTSIILFSREVAKASSSQHLLFMDMTISFTSFSDIGANFRRVGTSFVVGMYGLMSSNCFLMVRILFKQKSANSSASSTLDFPSGNGLDFTLPVIQLTML